MKRQIVCICAAMVFVLLLLGGCRKEPESKPLPILMYHHLDEQGDGNATVSVGGFRRQMELLKKEGYTPITCQQLVSFTEGGTLPEKPVLITFDDGYASNYRLAFPILKEYGFPATIFVIGCTAGSDTYKETGHPILPHFGKEEAKEMLASGLITLQTHTYDMHQSLALEQADPIRKNILPFEWESEADYVATLTADHQKERALLAEWGVQEHWAIAYPGGETCPLTDQTMQELGIKITLTTDGIKVNTITQYQPQTLIGLGRLSISETVTESDLLEYLNQHK